MIFRLISKRQPMIRDGHNDTTCWIVLNIYVRYSVLGLDYMAGADHLHCFQSVNLRGQFA